MNNKVKFIFGLLLIVSAFASAMGALYFFHERNQLSDQQVLALQVQLANLIIERSADTLSLEEQKDVQRDFISLEDVLARAEIIYGQRELQRREGILWVDRKASQYMITLGIVNGLSQGSSLGVYEERAQPGGIIINEKIADIVVQEAFEIISYVLPVDKSMQDFRRDYYRVRIINPL